jgi:hypothetical protein
MTTKKKQEPRVIALTAKEAWTLQHASMRKSMARQAYEELQAEEVRIVDAIKARAGMNGDPAGWMLEVRDEEIVLVEVLDGAG